MPDSSTVIPPAEAGDLSIAAIINTLRLLRI
jgi:hypothetical protein